MEERGHMNPMIDDEIDLVELFQKIWKHKWLVTSIAIVITLGSAIAVNIMQPKFKVSATIIPNNKEFLKLYFQDLRALKTSSEMKIISGEISLMHYTSSINAFFNSMQTAIDAFGTADTFDSSKFKSIEEQIAHGYTIKQETKDIIINIDVTHHSREIAVKFTHALIQEVNRKLNDHFSGGQNVQYLIVTDPPRLPQNPDRPKKTLIITISAVSSIFIGVFLALFIEWIRDAQKRYSRKDSAA